MELLAGDDDLEVELRESGALFRFSPAEVYWNSRLQAEHKRLADLVPERDATALTVWDVFGHRPVRGPARDQGRDGARE